jgi:SAM-dependent methyltransferase
VTRVEVPYPPFELATRVGALAADDMALYEEIGRRTREEILDLLPDGWSFEGKRVLDFGCGAGRTLRHFLGEAAEGEFHGCEIDGPSVDWLDAHLSPPLYVFRNEEAPPLPLEDASFDVIWAISVFTHLTDHWAGWLLELHRLLRDGGLLIATILGPALAEEWHPAAAGHEDPGVRPADRIGMNVLHFDRGWDLGGPAVFHSAWWIEEHWGRAFDIVSLREDGFIPMGEWRGQGVALLRKRPVELTVSELERIAPTDEREVHALRHNVRQLHRELKNERETREWLEAQQAVLTEQLARSSEQTT